MRHYWPIRPARPDRRVWKILLLWKNNQTPCYERRLSAMPETRRRRKACWFSRSKDTAGTLGDKVTVVILPANGCVTILTVPHSAWLNAAQMRGGPLRAGHETGRLPKLATAKNRGNPTLTAFGHRTSQHRRSPVRPSIQFRQQNPNLARNNRQHTKRNQCSAAWHRPISRRSAETMGSRSDCPALSGSIFTFAQISAVMNLSLFFDSLGPEHCSIINPMASHATRRRQGV